MSLSAIEHGENDKSNERNKNEDFSRLIPKTRIWSLFTAQTDNVQDAIQPHTLCVISLI